MINEKWLKKCIVIFILNFVLCSNTITYLLEIKPNLEWLNYSFKIDFHILKVLKTYLEVKNLKNDQNYQKMTITEKTTKF